MIWLERYDGSIFLCVVIACVALSLAGIMPGAMLSVALLGVGVALFGLPHGSLDVLVARRLFHLTSLRSFALFLTAYLAISAAYGIVWWRLPTLALASFLLISAAHFSTDWEGRGALVSRLAYGCAIVSLPSISHAADVGMIYRVLGAEAPDALLLTARIIAVPAVLLAIAGSFRRRRDLLELAGIVVGAIVLPPIVYFACYFCFLHSPRHLIATALEEHLSTLRQIAGHTALPTIAVCMAAAFLLKSPTFRNSSTHLLQIIFVGLAILTIPHMVLTTLAQRSARRIQRAGECG